MSRGEPRGAGHRLHLGRVVATALIAFAAGDDLRLAIPDPRNAGHVTTLALAYLGLIVVLWWPRVGTAVFFAAAVVGTATRNYSMLFLGAPIAAFVLGVTGRRRWGLVLLGGCVASGVAAWASPPHLSLVFWGLPPLAAAGFGLGWLVDRLRDAHARSGRRVVHAVEIRELAHEAHQRQLAIRLHDGIGHAFALAAVTATTQSLRTDGQTRAALESIRRTCAQGAQDLSAVVALMNRTPAPLGPSAPQELPHMVTVMSDALSDCGWDVTVEWPEALAGLSPAEHALVVRFLLEGTTNILKHAGTGAVTIKGDAAPPRIELANPRGEERSDDGGVGLASLKADAVALGWQLSTRTEADRWVAALGAAPEPT